MDWSYALRGPSVSLRGPGRAGLGFGSTSAEPSSKRANSRRCAMRELFVPVGLAGAEELTRAISAGWCRGRVCMPRMITQMAARPAQACGLGQSHSRHQSPLEKTELG